jgi:hypothetical protein
VNALFCDRGTIYNVIKGDSAGLFRFKPGPDHKHILFTDSNIEDRDAFSSVATLTGDQILYVFGKEVGNVVVSGEILMGALDKLSAVQSSRAFSELVNWFQTNRVSKKKGPVKLSVAGAKAYPVYIVGLTIGGVDPELNTARFSIYAKTTGE